MPPCASINLFSIKAWFRVCVPPDDREAKNGFSCCSQHLFSFHVKPASNSKIIKGPWTTRRLLRFCSREEADGDQRRCPGEMTDTCSVWFRRQVRGEGRSSSPGTLHRLQKLQNGKFSNSTRRVSVWPCGNKCFSPSRHIYGIMVVNSEIQIND